MYDSNSVYGRKLRYIINLYAVMLNTAEKQKRLLKHESFAVVINKTKSTSTVLVTVEYHLLQISLFMTFAELLNVNFT